MSQSSDSMAMDTGQTSNPQNFHHQAPTYHQVFTPYPPPSAERGGEGQLCHTPGSQDQPGREIRTTAETIRTLLRQEISTIEKTWREKMEATLSEITAKHDKQLEGIMRMMQDIIIGQKQKETPTTYAAAASKNISTGSNTTSGTNPKRAAPPQARVPPVAYPRDETDIKVWIKTPIAIERLKTASSGDMVKSINQRAEIDGNEGRATAARQIRNGNIIVATASAKDKKALMEKKGWLRALDQEAQIAIPTYLVLIHGVRYKAIDTKSPGIHIEKLIIDNEAVLQGTKIKRITWAKPKIPESQNYASLVASFECPAAANRAITRGMISECRVHICELYDANCKKRQCFNCQKFGHLATGCFRPEKCAHCAGHHRTSSCDQREARPRCAACGEDGHPSWARSCVLQKKEEQRIMEAKENRPLLYAEPASAATRTQKPDESGGESLDTGRKLTEYKILAPKRGRPRTKSPIKRKAIEPPNEPLTTQTEVYEEDATHTPEEEMEEAEEDQEEDYDEAQQLEEIPTITSKGRTSKPTAKVAQGKAQATIPSASKRATAAAKPYEKGRRVLKSISGNSKPSTRLSLSQSSKTSSDDVASC